MRTRLIVAIVIGIILLLISPIAQAFDPRYQSGSVSAPMFDARLQGCYARAMVGMDSVINSRVGVPPEHALGLSQQETTDGGREAVFDEPLLAMILSAYLWEGSPHSYAIKVFYDCAVSAPHLATRSDFLP